MSRILFTDESRFTVTFNDGRTRVRRRIGEHFIGDAVREIECCGDVPVMVWGGIDLNGTTPLYIIMGSLTGQRHRDEIVRPLIQPAVESMGPSATLQNDNATPHRARVVTDFPAAAWDPQDGLARMIS